MLSRALIFSLVTVGIFALLIGLIPTEFMISTYNPEYGDAQTETYFQASDLVMYDNSGADNMTYTYTSLDDAPNAPDWEAGLPNDQYLEVWWSTEGPHKCLENRHAEWISLWIFNGYWDYHRLEIYAVNGTRLRPSGYGIYDTIDFIDKTILEQEWNTDLNQSAFVMKCNHINTNFLVLRSNVSRTIGQNWDDGNLTYILTYELNWTKTGVSAWSLISKLFTFQAFDLGIEDTTLNLIVNTTVSLPIWILYAYILYKLITGLIPFVSGGGGD